jgi:hypothetical protein
MLCSTQGDECVYCWAGIKFNVRLENDHHTFYEIGYRSRKSFGEKAMVMKLQKLGYILALLK